MFKKPVLVVALAVLAVEAAPAYAEVAGSCVTHANPPATTTTTHMASAELFCGEVVTGMSGTHTVCLEILAVQNFSAGPDVFHAVGCTGHPFTLAPGEAVEGRLDIHSQPCASAGSTAGLPGTGVYRTHSSVDWTGGLLDIVGDITGDLHSYSEPMVLACRPPNGQDPGN